MKAPSLSFTLFSHGLTVYGFSQNKCKVKSLHNMRFTFHQNLNVNAIKKELSTEPVVIKQVDAPNDIMS